MAIQKVEKQRKIGIFAMQNASGLKDELDQVGEQLSFDGEDMKKSLPLLTQLGDLIIEPEAVSEEPKD